jgi:Putative prokaryotic signal transducing protein
MKTIATFWKTEEAHLLRLRLGEAGIPVFLQDEHITQLHPWRAAAIGGVRVQVADSDFDEAQGILSEHEIQPIVETPPGASDALVCCACQTLIPPEQTRCAACGWSYEDGGSAR